MPDPDTAAAEKIGLVRCTVLGMLAEAHIRRTKATEASGLVLDGKIAAYEEIAELLKKEARRVALGKHEMRQESRWMLSDPMGVNDPEKR